MESSEQIEVSWKYLIYHIVTMAVASADDVEVVILHPPTSTAASTRRDATIPVFHIVSRNQLQHEFIEDLSFRFVHRKSSVL